MKHICEGILLLAVSICPAVPAQETNVAPESIEAEVNAIFTSIRMTRSRFERDSLLRKLFMLGNKAEESVIEYLGDSDQSIVIDAVKFLGYIKSRKAKKQLMSLTIHPNRDIRFYAVLALKSYEADAVVNRIAEVIFEDKDMKVREAAVFSLMMIENPLKISCFIKGISSLKGETKNVCLSVFQNVLKDQRYALDLVRCFRKYRNTMPNFLAMDIVRALGDMADRRTIPFFREYLGSTYSDIRALCAIGLGKIGDTRAIDILCKHINDSSSAVREHVKRSLARITGFSGWHNPESAETWLSDNSVLIEHAVQYEKLIEKAMSSDRETWKCVYNEIELLNSSIGSRSGRIFSDIIVRCLLSGNTLTIDFAVECFSRFSQELTPGLQYILKHGSTKALVIEKPLYRACELASLISYRFGLAQNVPFIIGYLRNLEELNKNRNLLIKEPAGYLCLQGITGAAYGKDIRKWEKWWRRNRKRISVQKNKP